MRFSNENEKKIILIAAFVIVAVLLYSLSINITGFVTDAAADKQAEETKKQLGDAQMQMQSASSQLAACENNLSYINPLFAQCSLDMIQKEKSLEACNNDISSCENSLSAYTANYNAALSNYKSLAASSAASICCTFSDFQAGTIKSWQISDNKISCNAGNLTINCRTGESNI